MKRFVTVSFLAVLTIPAFLHATIRLQLSPANMHAIAAVERHPHIPVATAFCIDSSGLFISSISMVKAGPFDLVLDVGEKGERRVPATLVRSDEATGLVLLKAAAGKDFASLKLAAVDPTDDGAAVTVAGFLAGSGYVGMQLEHPIIELPKRTLLFLQAAPIVSIKLDHRMVDWRESGGPVIDAQRHVVGIVTADERGPAEKVIPASAMSAFLKKVEIDFDPPTFSPSELQKTQTLPIHIEKFDKNPRDIELTLTIASPDHGEKEARQIKAKRIGVDSYSVTFVPLPDPALETPPSLHFSLDATEARKTMASLSGVFRVAQTSAIAFDAPQLKTDELHVKLPAAAREIVEGGGGRYLLLRLGVLHKIAVFDAAVCKITGYVPIEDDNELYAAGAKWLLCIMPTRHVISRWSLSTLTREFETALPPDLQPGGAAMGSASDGPLVLADAESPKFIDPVSLRLIDVKLDHLDLWEQRGRWPQRERAAADGSMFCQTEGQNALVFFNIRGMTATTTYEIFNGEFKVCRPSPDGRLILTDAGIASADGFKDFDSDQFRNLSSVPSCDSQYFLTVLYRNRFNPVGDVTPDSKTTFSLYCGIDQPVLFQLPELPELSGMRWPRMGGGMPLEQRIHLISRAKLLITFSESDDELVVRPFDPVAVMKKLGIDYLFVDSSAPTSVLSGGSIHYLIHVNSSRGGLKFDLEARPDGMMLSPGGLINWTAAQPPGSHATAVIRISDAAGQDVRHRIHLTITASNENRS